MATRTRTKTVVRRSSGGGRKLARLQSATAARNRRNTAERNQRDGDVLSIIASAAMGYADREGWLDKFPVVGELGAPAVAGVALYMAPMLFRGTGAQKLQRAGAGLLAVAAYELAEEWGAGSPQ